ncbi:hypothetical protein LV780_20235 (plasmid) [Cereibacter azotoformans]|uniref:hypothetical protein n=1 Tax=Cereibacter azotoformans TaxID=43057 RepID=UPI001F46F761|nr:hypothetical protein [Cereibacter azotoformans]UIJ32910.1 hypothetical protein LV780_20235 [Cereibacter azotoformans]
MLKRTAAAILIAALPATGWAGRTVVEPPPEVLPDVFAPTIADMAAVAAQLGDPELAAALASAEPGSPEALSLVATILNAYAERMIALGSLPPMTAEERAAALELLNNIARLTGSTPATRELVRMISSGGNG